MKKQTTSDEWAQEYQEFLSVDQVEPPKHLSRQILSQVHTNLNPTPWLVFSKLTLIHALVGSITLLFCPQFGLSPLSGMGLMGFFMRFGDHVCMLACGAVFLGGSALVASLVMHSEEVGVIRRTEFLQLSILGLLSLAAFIYMGAGIILSLAVFWLLGSVLGGLTTLELGWVIRTQLRKSHFLP